MILFIIVLCIISTLGVIGLIGLGGMITYRYMYGTQYRHNISDNLYNNV
jgi:hypothetical protein